MTHRIDYLDRLPVNVKYDLVKQVIHLNISARHIQLLSHFLKNIMII